MYVCHNLFIMGVSGVFHGLLTIDFEYLTGTYPDENTKTKAKLFEYFVGGPATNAAITFAHLGGEAKLFTAIGENPFSGMIRHELENQHVSHHDYLSNIDKMPTFASVIVSEESGERTVMSYHPEPLGNGIRFPGDQQGKIALIDGFHMPQAIEAAAACREQGIPVVFDGGSWKKNTSELLSFIDIAICSANFFPPNTSSREEVIRYLQDCGVGKIVITRGKKPIIYTEGVVNLTMDIPAVEAIDTLAAGDIFHGAFCFYYGGGLSFTESLGEAIAIASKSCTHFGPRKWMDHPYK